MTMLTHQHASRLLSDYVLDLLPQEARQAVELHVAACPDCRVTVLRERQLGQLIRQTVAQATRPGPTQLQHLMPPPPRTTQPLATAIRWLRAPAGRVIFAALALMLLLTLGSYRHWPGSVQPAGWSQPAEWHSPSQTALAATTTRQPTMTATVAQAAGTLTVVPPTEISVAPAPPPAPAGGTPVASPAP